MKTIIFLFNRETYKEGLNLESRFNIFRWTYDMCNKEVEEVDDCTIAMKIEMSDEDTLAAFEGDFNDEKESLNWRKYIMRCFIINE